MSKYRKYKPYIRRMKDSDFSTDFRTAIRLGMLPSIYPKKQIWVMCQHGVKGVIAVDLSKEEMKNSILGVAIREMTFKEWQIALKKRAQAGTMV